MNILEAKTEIANTLRAYLQKDAWGSYLLSAVHQRPILLMGPPGIGKTAIMEQIAREADVALVAYTMTHHTRQSAVGLPRIVTRELGGQTRTMTEYTLSEIIASVYEAMERTGKSEGILFLDEINCVSETLSPTMLQFLQCKTFGNHRLPEGWLIVAAGNPPEFNKSVREFDVVTLDRVRQLDVTADVDCFLAYAARQGVHGAILSYLRLKPDRFYRVRRTEDELSFVTARGWEDLSRLLQRYEALDIPVTEEIMGEFLRWEELCRDFARYYRLYRKYGTDYAVNDLLSGEISAAAWEERTALARKGDFAERHTVVQLLLDGVFLRTREYARCDRFTVALREALKVYLGKGGSFAEYVEQRRLAVETKKRLELLSHSEHRFERQLLARLTELETAARESHIYAPDETEAFLRKSFEDDIRHRAALSDGLQQVLDNAFRFVSDAFGDGPELTLLLTGLSSDPEVMDYIALRGCPAYLAHSERLMCRENEEELLRRCREALEES